MKKKPNYPQSLKWNLKTVALTRNCLFLRFMFTVNLDVVCFCMFLCSNVDSEIQKVQRLYYKYAWILPGSMKSFIFGSSKTLCSVLVLDFLVCNWDAYSSKRLFPWALPAKFCATWNQHIPQRIESPVYLATAGYNISDISCQTRAIIKKRYSKKRNKNISRVIYLFL